MKYLDGKRQKKSGYRKEEAVLRTLDWKQGLENVENLPHGGRPALRQLSTVRRGRCGSLSDPQPESQPDLR